MMTESDSVRYHMIKSLFRDLLGPKMDPEEIIENPFDQYTLGILKSMHKSKKTIEEFEPVTDPSEKVLARLEKHSTDLDLEEHEEENYLVDADLNPMQGARSLGISFVVEGESPKIKLCCTWGRYENIPGLPSSVWKRNPNFFISKEINLNQKKLIIIPEDKKSPKNISMPGVEIHVRTSKLQGKNSRNISIFLVNNTPFVEKQKQEHYIFQPQIRIICNESTMIGSLGRTRTTGDPANDDLLFWNHSNKGRGHLCGAVWREVDPECHQINGTSFADFSWPDKSSIKIGELSKDFEKCDIRTEYLPAYTILQPDLSESSESFEASVLAEKWESLDIRETLGTIVNNYLDWEKNQRTELSKFKEMPKLLQQAQKNLDDCKIIASRIDEGIKLLESDEKARLAFCLMNKVMSDKRRWDNRDKSEPEQALKWYEFQMAFILQTLKDVIPGNADDKKICDILWFPTGGGKTESYLGLMIFAFAYRRLLGLEGYNVDGGVSVLSRYTLRLLTIQQFTRSLGAILAAEMCRIRNWTPKKFSIKDPKLAERKENGCIWGKSRFSLGLWIGDLTPNIFKKQGTKFMDILNAHGSLQPSYDRRKDSEPHGEPAQITECPCCGEILAVSSEKENKSENPTKKLTWIIKTEKTIQELEAIPDSQFKGDQIVLKQTKTEPAKMFSEINVNDIDKTRYVSFSINFTSETNRSLSDDRIDKWWKFHVKHALGYTEEENPLQCTRASRPGYFFLCKDGENKPYDFAIHCPNSKCEINSNEWFEESVPSSIPSIPQAFRSTRPTFSIFPPIPAFTIDEQIYSRCPTVVIATADKFARMPFEPKVSSLFGNVDCYDRWDGYGRGDPDEKPTRERITRFLPPSLIIQDELHLIEGPLGSMVGLYEMAVDILASTGKFTPKYIASTATIREAESQVGTIYRRGARIFPPPGISYGDNYFSKIKEDPSCMSERQGRLYLGILAPKGTLIVPVKIWASLLSTTQRILACPQLFGLDKKFQNANFHGTLDEFVKKEIDWYRTLVGYFSANRELSISRNLYEVILRDVRKWSTIIQSSVSHITKDVKTDSALRYVPIKINKDMEISTVSIFSKNRDGYVSIAVYDNDDTKNVPRNQIQIMRQRDQKKLMKNDENEFFVDQKFNVSKGDLLWIAIYNYSDKTRFYNGSSEIKSRITDDATIQKDMIVFPQQHTNSDEINNTIKILLKTKSRDLEPTNIVELSSATESQKLPKIMEQLQKIPNTIDSLFTTSMFGTGIDIDRLGLMAVMGQPKSTSSYIQSTGRIGRKCPGLIVTWLRAGGVRDLNHYENFVGYHRSIHRYVEPISAAPFSEETMNLCMGPVTVAILRNAKFVKGKQVQTEWRDPDEGPLFMHSHSTNEDVIAVKEALVEICSSNHIAEFRKMEKKDVEDIMDRTIAKWQKTANILSKHGNTLVYQEYTMNKKAEENVVLGTPQHRIAGKNIVYKNTRTSLRNVEATSTIGDSGWVGNS